MIVYNHVYRGAFEYDKFILNILSFYNIVENLDLLELNGEDKEMISLSSVYEEINNIFDKFTGKDGISENTFLLALQERKCIKL